MRSHLAIGGTLLLLLAACTAASRRVQFEPASQQQPTVGRSLDLGEGTRWVHPEGSRPDLQGKTLLVQFAAPGCRGCAKMNPRVEEWSETFRPRGLEVVRVIDGRHYSEEQVKQYVDDEALGSAILLDTEGRLFESLAVAATPTFLLASRSSRIYWSQATARPEVVLEWIEEALARDQGGP